MLLISVAIILILGLALLYLPSLRTDVATAATSATTPAVTSAIPLVQGTGEASPLEGQSVMLEGVVTGDFQGSEQLNGFFLQDALGDGKLTTSDGLFVYVPRANTLSKVDVKPGDMVQVSGVVTEFKGLTQIERVSSVVVRRNGVMPRPVEVKLPLEPALRESMEGMLVTISQPLTISGNHGLARYGELVLSAQGRLFVPTNGQGSSRESALARRLVLDDGSSRANPDVPPYLDKNGTRRSGDTLQQLTGIFSFGFDEYRIQPTIAPVFVSANPRPLAPESIPGELKVGSFNVENYFTTFKSQNPKARGAANAEEFQERSGRVVAALRALDADVMGLIEIENNGATAIGDLVTRLNKAYGKTTYAAIADPQQGSGSDLIKVAFIYKPASVEAIGAAISDTSKIFERRPMAQAFRSKKGAQGSFIAVVNHFKSKGGCPDTGDVDTGQGCWNNKRDEQAKALLRFVQTLNHKDGEGDILILGDLNAYGDEDPVRTIRKAGFAGVEESIPLDRRYSYVFDGQAGSLDHGLATSTLKAQVTGATIWHINADELRQSKMKRPAQAASSAGSTGKPSQPFGASDHDPLLVGLTLKTDKVERLTLRLDAEKVASADSAISKGKGDAASENVPGTDQLVNINSAMLKELDALPGIGKVTAQAIVDYREKNGPFKEVEELDKVRGIGKKTMEKLRPLVTAQ